MTSGCTVRAINCCVRFFVDSNLSVNLAKGMRAFGENVEHLQKHFPPDAPDTEWPLRPKTRPAPIDTRLSRQRRDHAVHNGFRLGAHLYIGRILNGMRDENGPRILHAKRLGLRGRRIDEFARRDRNRGLALNLEPYRVMQTARGTGASVSQRLDHEIVL